MVNFTVTMNSLQVYCLDQLLKFEQPTSFTQRRELQKRQSECQVKLLQLEKQLLDVLFQSSGKILEDNVVLSALEQLKREALIEEQKVTFFSISIYFFKALGKRNSRNYGCGCVSWSKIPTCRVSLLQNFFCFAKIEESPLPLSILIELIPQYLLFSPQKYRVRFFMKSPLRYKSYFYVF